jgi:hypothetical protein
MRLGMKNRIYFSLYYSVLGTTVPALRTLSRPARVLRTTDPPPNLVLDYMQTCNGRVSRSRLPNSDIARSPRGWYGTKGGGILEIPQLLHLSSILYNFDPFPHGLLSLLSFHPRKPTWQDLTLSCIA